MEIQTTSIFDSYDVNEALAENPDFYAYLIGSCCETGISTSESTLFHKVAGANMRENDKFGLYTRPSVEQLTSITKRFALLKEGTRIATFREDLPTIEKDTITPLPSWTSIYRHHWTDDRDVNSWDSVTDSFYLMDSNLPELVSWFSKAKNFLSDGSVSWAPTIAKTTTANYDWGKKSPDRYAIPSFETKFDDCLMVDNSVVEPFLKINVPYFDNCDLPTIYKIVHEYFDASDRFRGFLYSALVDAIDIAGREDISVALKRKNDEVREQIERHILSADIFQKKSLIDSLGLFVGSWAFSIYLLTSDVPGYLKIIGPGGVLIKAIKDFAHYRIDKKQLEKNNLHLLVLLSRSNSRDLRK